MNYLSRAALIALVALTFVACDDDTDSGSSNDNNGGNNAVNNGGENNTGENNTGENNGGENNTGENNTGENNAEPMCDESLTERPSARAEMMGAFDPETQRLFLFGGDEGVPVECRSSPKPVGELWVYDSACATFEQIDYEDGPTGRARGIATYDSKRGRMIMFGGRWREATSGPYELYDEVWALDFETLEWEEINTVGRGPGPRVNTSFDYNPATDEVILFGGNSSDNGAFFEPHNDVWGLNLRTKEWRRIETNAGPSVRLFHVSGLDPESGKLYIYGGGGEDAFFGAFYGDLWSLDLESGEWEMLYDESPGGPIARIWGTMTFYNGMLYIFGGHYDLDVQNDTWSFDPETGEWTVITDLEPTGIPDGQCSLPLDFTEINYDAPERRQGHLAAVDATRGEWIVFGGKTDCGAIDDVWAFDFNRESWGELGDATIGEACARQQDPESCVAYCQ